MRDNGYRIFIVPAKGYLITYEPKPQFFSRGSLCDPPPLVSYLQALSRRGLPCVKTKFNFNRGSVCKVFCLNSGRKINATTPWFIGGGRRALFVHHAAIQNVACWKPGISSNATSAELRFLLPQEPYLLRQNSRWPPGSSLSIWSPNQRSAYLHWASSAQ